MGRPPIGKHAMTGAERLRRHRLKLCEDKIAAARAERLKRDARVNRHMADRKARKDGISLQKHNRQVAEFLEACKVWAKALEEAGIAVSKFSPEARKFTARKLSAIAQAETLLAQTLTL